MSPAEFCRAIEAYLCRKNDGHLIRIVGPVFVKVCGWAEQGVPIKIAQRGIDRYCDRQQAKNPGPRRRPVRVEFCEADILDAFDEWRRAVGVGMAGARAEAPGEAPGAAGAARLPAAGGARTAVGFGGAGDAGGANGVGARSGDGPAGDASIGSAATGGAATGEEAGAGSAARRQPGLQTHIDRAMARLTQCRVEAGTPGALGAAIDRALQELDTLRAGARGVRGEARATVIARLQAVDRALIEAARAALEAPMLSALRSEAARELEPFRSRLAPDAWQTAAEAALDRLIRERIRLPSLHVDG